MNDLESQNGTENASLDDYQMHDSNITNEFDDTYDNMSGCSSAAYNYSNGVNIKNNSYQFIFTN